MMAELIRKEDTLNQGREKLNESIKDSNKAKEDSGEALDKANTALDKSESTQTQLDTIVIEGDSSVEAAQARVDSVGHTYHTLKDRLDTEFEELDGKIGDNYNEVILELAKKTTVLRDTKVVNIPTDYPTLQDAVNYMSGKKSINEVEIILNIESGHKLTKGLLVENGDYGDFKIVSEDTFVLLENEFEGIISEFDEGGNVIVGRNARMPQLATIIDMEGNFHDGYHATNSSNGYVAPNCGVINAGHSGLECRTSLVYANKTVFTGCFYGYRAEQGGIIMAQQGNADNAVSDGILASRGSMIQFAEGTARNSQERGCRSQRSRIVCIYADFSNAQGNGLMAREGSYISASNVKLNDCVGTALVVSGSSTVDANSVECNGSGMSIKCLSSSIVNAPNGQCNNSEGTSIEVDSGSTVNIKKGKILEAGDHAVECKNGSTVNAEEVDCSRPRRYGIRATHGSTVNFREGVCNSAIHSALFATNNSVINARSSEIKDSTGSLGAVFCQSGSNINVSNSNVSGHQEDAFNVSTGGIIISNDTVGSTSQALNEITADGIIFG